jgi:Ala-tRNA(Pro) deacylase
VKLDGELAMTVVPATRAVNFEQLKAAAGATSGMLAEETEFLSLFPGCEVGAMPPFGHFYGLPLYVEKDLAKEEYIAFSAGTHSDVIAMTFADYRRVAHPKLAHIAMPPVAELARLL